MLPNSFRSAAWAWASGAKRILGYARGMAAHRFNERQKSELRAAIRGDVDIVMKQCLGFARNRGIGLEFESVGRGRAAGATHGRLGSLGDATK